MVRFLCSIVKEVAIKSCMLNIALHWKPTVVIMATLSSLVRSEAALVVAYNFTSGDKVAINNNCRFSVFINSIMRIYMICCTQGWSFITLWQKKCRFKATICRYMWSPNSFFSIYAYWNVLWRVKQSPSDRVSPLVQEITLSRLGDKPSSEPMVTKTLKNMISVVYNELNAKQFKKE